MGAPHGRITASSPSATLAASWGPTWRPDGPNKNILFRLELAYFNAIFARSFTNLRTSGFLGSLMDLA